MQRNMPADRQNHGRRWFTYIVAFSVVFVGVIAVLPQQFLLLQLFSGESKTTPVGFLIQENVTSTESDIYLRLLSPKIVDVNASLNLISENWHAGSTAMIIEAARFARNPQSFAKIIALAEAKTGQKFGRDVDKWRQWIWKQDYDPHPQYANFKSDLYSKIDPRFAEYFRVTKDSKIRLDEIRWGGVVRDGIPPLKDPKMLAAAEADYLADTDVVFGVELNRDARFYPQRILAWHEMFKDTIGGESVCVVY